MLPDKEPFNIYSLVYEEFNHRTTAKKLNVFSF